MNNHLMLIPILAFLAVGIIPLADAAKISVIQEGLTPEEQKVLDDIAEAKANGTYVQPPIAAVVEDQDKFIVEITVPHSISEQSPPFCQTQWEGFVPVTICSIRGMAPDGSEPIWDIEKEEWSSELIVEAEAKAAAETVQASVKLTKDQKMLEAIQNKIDALQTKHKLLPSEQQALDILTDLSFCSRGLIDTEAFQTRNMFVIPVESVRLVDGEWTIVFPQVDEDKAYETRGSGLYAKMHKASQECKAQTILMGEVSPDHYRNKIHNEADVQAYHADQATLSNPMPSRNDGDPSVEESRSNAAICDNQNFDRKFKKQMGCDSPYPESRPVTGGSNDISIPVIASPIHHQYMHHLVCGMISYSHIVNDIDLKALQEMQEKYPSCDEQERRDFIQSMRLK